MKKLFLAMLFLLMAEQSYGDHWQNVEIDKTLGCSLARSLAEDSHGALYAIGSGSPDCKKRSWIVKRSLDHGANWSEVDNFSLKRFSTEPAAIAIGPQNSVIVVGKREYLAKTGQVQTQWITRISKDGQNWKTKDKVQFPDLSWTRAAGVATDHLGNIFVFGSVQQGYINANRPAQCKCKILIRKSSDLGKSWSTVVVRENFYLWSVGLTISPQGELYAISQGQTVDQGSTKFLVEKSVDSGATWTEIDHFGLFSGGEGSHATTIYIGETGTLYAAGLSAQTPKDAKHWIVRKSEDGGNHWSTIDDYTGDGTEYFWPESVYEGARGEGATGENATGEVFVAGYYYRNKDLVSWIVRKFKKDHWENSDDFTSENKNAGASGIFGDFVTGHIFAAGFTDGYWTLKAYIP